MMWAPMPRLAPVTQTAKGVGRVTRDGSVVLFTVLWRVGVIFQPRWSGRGVAAMVSAVEGPSMQHAALPIIESVGDGSTWQTFCSRTHGSETRTLLD